MGKIFTAVAVIAFAMSANAMQSSQDSLNGSSTVAEGLFGASSTTVQIGGNSLASTLESSADSTSAISEAIIDGAIFVITDPSGASEVSAESTSNAVSWVFTKTWNILVLSGKHVVGFIENPSKSMAISSQFSGEVIGASIDAAGNLLSASGEFLSDAYGDDARLVLNGSGQVFTASAGSIVAVSEGSVDASKAVINFIDETSVAAVSVSVEEASDLVSASVEASGDVFNALKSGYQYGN